eukprot:TRINITY_DN1720_c0_g1_i3.p1 TRINITY_DN1720_c0_g1~~TRINITY_DN1720_c0_g1_i3.p1  ORF type:complete len:177 (-),score=81.68 TRINITY_DN1720_c0_g1_i3:163-693(-)
MAAKQKREELELLAQAQKSTQERFHSPELNLLRGVSSVVLAALPAYLFATVYELSPKTYALLYVAVSAITIALLNIAYRNMTASSVDRLEAQRKAAHAQTNYKKLGYNNVGEMNAVLQQNTLAEAGAWSFLFANTAFVLCFAFLSFYALSASELVYNYPLSMVISSLLVWQLSTAK